MIVPPPSVSLPAAPHPGPLPEGEGARPDAGDAFSAGAGQLGGEAGAPRLGWHLEGLLAHGPLAVLFTWPLVLNLGGNGLAPGVMTVDVAQNLWNLWWVKTALLDLHTNPFNTDRIWYPTPVSLYFHTLNPFNGLVSIPFQAFMTLPAILSGIVLFSFVLAGWGAYLLVLYVLERGGPGLGVGARRAGALVGSAAFTYSAYHIATQRGQLQLVSLEWAPFYLLGLLRAVHDWPPLRTVGQGGRWLGRAALPAAGFLVLIALVDWYYVMYMVLFTLLYGLYLAGRAWVGAADRRAGLAGAGEALARLAVIGALAGLFTSPILAPMLHEAQTESYMRPQPGVAFANAADLLTFFLPPLDQHWWGQVSQLRWDWPAGEQRYEVYFGYVALALAAVGLVAWRGIAKQSAILPLRGATPPQSAIGLPGRGFWAGCILIFFSLALGPALQVGGVALAGVPMPYGIIERIPGFNISRSPDRFDMPLTLALGVLAGQGAAALAGRVRGVGQQTAVGVGLTGLMFVELWPVPYPQSPMPQYSYYQNVLSRDPGDYPIVELPPQDDYWHGAFAMYQQTAHQKRIYGGYLSREFAHPFLADTAGFRDFAAGIAPSDMFVDTPDERLTALAQYNARYVVLYKMNIMRPTKPVTVDVARYRALIQNVLGPLAATQPVHSDEQLEVYRVPPPMQTVPYLVLGDNWYPVEAPDQHRWMRGQQSSLQVADPYAPTKATLVMEIASFHRARTLDVRVNGAAVRSLSIAPEVAAYRVPDIPLQNGLNTVTLSTLDAPESPQALGVSADTRSLTLMFRQVELAAP